MKVFICDDDLEDIARLKTLIDEYARKNHMEFAVSGYRSGVKMLDAIRKGKTVDIIFLDINMDAMDGLTVAKRIRERLEDVPIILVTSFMSFALDGYKVRASRFLIKDDLDRTFSECMDDICNELQRRSKTICCDCVEGNIRLKTSEIILIETEGHKCLIQLKDRTYQIYEKLEELEERLKAQGFLRTHKSFLVNMEHIRNINSYILTLDNDRQISVPKARYKQVKQEYTLYEGKKL